MQATASRGVRNGVPSKRLIESGRAAVRSVFRPIANGGYPNWLATLWTKVGSDRCPRAAQGVEGFWLLSAGVSRRRKAAPDWPLIQQRSPRATADLGP